MQDAKYRVTESEHREWHSQFGEQPAEGARLEADEAELQWIAEEAARLQAEDNPEADCVSSGIILPLIGEKGLSGAFEAKVEELAEAIYRSGTAAIRTVSP